MGELSAIPARGPQGLRWFAIASLIAGVAAILCAPVPYLCLIVGAVAVALAWVATRQSRWKGAAIAGVILGSLALLVSIGTLLIAFVFGGTPNTHF